MAMKLTKGPVQLNGACQVPGDKSISHRAVMFGALAKGRTVARHFLFSADCLATIGAFEKLGVTISRDETSVTIEGVGFHGFKPAKQSLDMGNSGTSTRLLLGLLAKQPFPMRFIGDASLSQRPMGRVLAPLTQMGAQMTATAGHLPIEVASNTHLQAIDYQLPVASAQVKSALIFAALQADGPSTLTEKLATRDHTERMLRLFGGDIQQKGLALKIKPQTNLTGQTFTIPGDPSSAAFFIAAATLLPNSEVILLNVGLNQTRIGFLEVLGQMQSDIQVIQADSGFEPTGTLKIKSASLQAMHITADMIPSIIDELPLVALCATQAEGVTTISGAAELRVKETDRIATVTAELRKMGAHIEEKPDGMVITGPTPLHAVNAQLDSHGDHRIAMMLMVAALLSKDQFTLENADAVAVSYPKFYEDLLGLVN
ncbi:3-phosphoshikimate 1-carboxyvinyltransferase [Agrilactobacillus fermenti]|uniref:3-phosphoshikimate 1-carboxyvinyltransferase n=1 Tax=Agrilactobacillus fermenti TaxID=2586909 RepID=UPI003A5BB61A